MLCRFRRVPCNGPTHSGKPHREQGSRASVPAPRVQPLRSALSESTLSAPAGGDSTAPVQLASTGIAGLDDILRGGLPVGRLYLVDGAPGAGKTTLALQFLLEGVRSGERGLYVTLSESRAELVEVATSHGWDLDRLDVFELPPQEAGEEAYTLFHPAEVELQGVVDRIFTTVKGSGARLGLRDYRILHNSCSFQQRAHLFTEILHKV
jgi:hypothetical protein